MNDNPIRVKGILQKTRPSLAYNLKTSECVIWVEEIISNIQERLREVYVPTKRKKRKSERMSEQERQIEQEISALQERRRTTKISIQASNIIENEDYNEFDDEMEGEGDGDELEEENRRIHEAHKQMAELTRRKSRLNRRRDIKWAYMQKKRHVIWKIHRDSFSQLESLTIFSVLEAWMKYFLKIDEFTSMYVRYHPNSTRNTYFKGYFSRYPHLVDLSFGDWALDYNGIILRDSVIGCWKEFLRTIETQFGGRLAIKEDEYVTYTIKRLIHAQKIINVQHDYSNIREEDYMSKLRKRTLERAMRNVNNDDDLQPGDPQESVTEYRNTKNNNNGEYNF